MQNVQAPIKSMLKSTLWCIPGELDLLFPEEISWKLEYRQAIFGYCLDNEIMRASFWEFDNTDSHGLSAFPSFFSLDKLYCCQAQANWGNN